MKTGTVALIGRPNSGKSTLVNNLVGRKVAITSPKPQTTQFPVFAVLDLPTRAPTSAWQGVPLPNDAQIIFVDTPGIFGKAKSARIEGANLDTERTINQDIDVVLYIIDHTRRRGREENKVLGMVRKVKVPKILVINKIDRESPDYSEEYKFMEDEFDDVVKVSALKQKNLPALLEAILKYLKEGDAQIIAKDMPTPALNLDSKLFIAENIREKAFLSLHDELPYTLRVIVDEVVKRKSTKVYYIKARILTTDKRYKKMIIGEGARKIKQISSMARRELEIATGQRIYLELSVEVEE